MRPSATCIFASLRSSWFASLTSALTALVLCGAAGAQTPDAAGVGGQKASQSFFPQACTVLQAHNSSTEVRENVFDTARLQAALDACPRGKAVELVPDLVVAEVAASAAGPAADAFLIGPIRIPAGVTLLVDAGVKLLGSRRPADYASGLLQTLDAPCGTMCRPLIEITGGSTEPAALMGFGIVDGRGSLQLIEATPQPRTWFDLAPAARPALISAAGTLFVNSITLVDAPGDAIHFTAARALLVESAKIVSAPRPGTRGIVVENPAASLTLSGSTISVAGASLSMASAGAPTPLIDDLRLYAGAGILPLAPGQSPCVASSAPILHCFPALLPPSTGQLFLSQAGATNLRSTTATSPVTLHAVMVQIDLLSAETNEPVSFFDGSTLLGEARVHGTVADFPLPDLKPGAHRLTAVAGSVRSGPVELTIPAALHTLGFSTSPVILVPDSSRLPWHAVLHITASVASYGSDPVASGTITLAEGSTLLGSSQVGADGTARFETASLALGPHVLAASYTGDASHGPSNSQPLAIEIVYAPQAAPFVLSSSSTTVFNGQPFTVSALGLPADASGTVTLTRNQAPIASIPVVPTVAPSLVSFGDSLTSGFGLGPNQAYPALMASSHGMNLNDLALPGTASCDLLTGQILPSGTGPTEAGAPLYTIMSGSNDAYTLEPERAFIACEQGAMAWLAIPREYKVLAGDAGVQALSPGWQYTPGNNFNTLRNSSGIGTARFPITTSGNPIYLWYLLDNQAPGTFSVFLDGSSSPAAEVALPLPGVNSAFGKGFLLLRIPAPAGAHTVEIVAHAPAVAILGVATPPLAGALGVHPTVLVSDVPYQNTSGGRDPASVLAQLSLDAQQNVALLRADGLDVRFVATRNVMFGTPTEMRDAVHANALGQAEFASVFNAALAGSSSADYAIAFNSGLTAALQLRYTGVQSIAASYSGDSLYVPASAPPIDIGVLDAATLTTLSASSADVALNTPVTLSASILPVSAAGQVSFFNQDPVPGQGSAVLGTVAVANGHATLTVTLPPGVHALTAALNNSDGRQPSSSAVLTVVVEKPAPIVTLTPAAQRIPYGQFAPLLATMLPGATTNPLMGAVIFSDNSAGPLGQAAVVNGQAAFSASALPAGLHTITAAYTGDAGNGPAIGPPVSVQVVRAPVSPNLFTATPIASLGTAIAVHVDLLTAGAPPIPAPSASFSADLNRTSVFLGDSLIAGWPLPVNNRGIAGQTTAELSQRFAHDVLGQGFERVILLAGTDEILHTGNDPSTTLSSIKSMTDLAAANGIRVILCTLPPLGPVGSALNVRVVALNVSLTAFAQQNALLLVDYYSALATHPEDFADGVHPNAFGQALMETQLARTVLVPTGTATLPDGTSASLSTTGTADLIARNLPVGTSSVTVGYSGDANFEAGSAALPISIGQASSATTLTAQPLIGYSGSAALLTAVVANSASLPSTGTVTFNDGATSIGSASLTAGGKAILRTQNLTPGAHNFIAIYAGDANFTSSTSAAAPLTVRFVDTSVSLSSAGVSFVYGAPVTLTAAISSPTATGTLTFLDGSTVLAQQPVSQGGASFTTSSLSLHGHVLSAAYSGDSLDSPSTSPALALTINPIPTTLTLGSLAASAPYGQALTLAASVTPAAVSGQAVSGQVTWTDLYTPSGGATTSQTLGQTSLAGDRASLSLPTLAIGTHVFTAIYGGDTTHLSSTSGPVTTIILPGLSTTAVVASSTSAAYGIRIGFTVQVSPTTASGTVLLRDSRDGSLVQLTLAGGQASWSSASLSPGLHSVTASYSGDAVTDASLSPAAALTVTLAPSTVALAPLAPALLVGHPLTLSATVIPASATGNVTFRDAGAGTLGQAPVVQGIATLTLRTLPAGAYILSAAYSGDGFDLPSSSAPLGTQINLNPSSLTLAPLPASAPFGTSLTLIANLTAAGAASATSVPVSFFDGASPLGRVVPVNGIAGFSLSSTAPGPHSLSAVFAGDALYAASSSPAQMITILPDNTTTTVTVAQTSVPAGLPVILNVQVASTAATPSGSVTFRSGGRLLAVATLSHGSGTSAYATVSVDSASLGLGSFAVAAFYSGDANNALSDSSASPAYFRVVATPTSTVLSLPAKRVPVETATTLTASIASITVPATGTVTFVSNGVALATVPVSATGTASTTLPWQAIGSYQLSASYVPTGLFAASSAVETLIVTPPLIANFTSPTLNASANSTAVANLEITPLSGYTGAIAVQCTSPVSFLRCTVDAPPAVNGPANAAVRVTIPASLIANASSRDVSGTFAALLLLLLPLASRRRLRLQLAARITILGTLAALTLGVSGCASGGSFYNIPSGPQTLTVTVTAAGTVTAARLTVNIAP